MGKFGWLFEQTKLQDSGFRTSWVKKNVITSKEGIGSGVKGDQWDQNRGHITEKGDQNWPKTEVKSE